MGADVERRSLYELRPRRSNSNGAGVPPSGNEKGGAAHLKPMKGATTSVSSEQDKMIEVMAKLGRQGQLGALPAPSDTSPINVANWIAMMDLGDSSDEQREVVINEAKKWFAPTTPTEALAAPLNLPASSRRPSGRGYREAGCCVHDNARYPIVGKGGAGRDGLLDSGATPLTLTATTPERSWALSARRD